MNTDEMRFNLNLSVFIGAPSVAEIHFSCLLGVFLSVSGSLRLHLPFKN